jgi:hypothetical protein
MVRLFLLYFLIADTNSLRPSTLRQIQGVRKAIYFRVERLADAVAEVKLAFSESRVKVKN